jgi:hypothetical protein
MGEGGGGGVGGGGGGGGGGTLNAHMAELVPEPSPRVKQWPNKCQNPCRSKPCPRNTPPIGSQDTQNSDSTEKSKKWSPSADEVNNGYDYILDHLPEQDERLAQQRLVLDVDKNPSLLSEPFVLFW